MDKPSTIQTCRVCGCTEADCQVCVARTGMPCSWVAEDLCSACLGYLVDMKSRGFLARVHPPRLCPVIYDELVNAGLLARDKSNHQGFYTLTPAGMKLAEVTHGG